MKALAISNNDMVHLRWSVEQKIAGCLGFTIHREDLATGKSGPLPTWVGFRAVPNQKSAVRNSDTWPIQKFQWKDVTAKRGGRYRYRITLGYCHSCSAHNARAGSVTQTTARRPRLSGWG